MSESCWLWHELSTVHFTLQGSCTGEFQTQMGSNWDRMAEFILIFFGALISGSSRDSCLMVL